MKIFNTFPPLKKDDSSVWITIAKKFGISSSHAYRIMNGVIGRGSGNAKLMFQKLKLEKTSKK